jgi:hypothetical protein
MLAMPACFPLKPREIAWTCTTNGWPDWPRAITPRSPLAAALRVKMLDLSEEFYFGDDLGLLLLRLLLLLSSPPPTQATLECAGGPDVPYQKFLGLYSKGSAHDTEVITTLKNVTKAQAKAMIVEKIQGWLQVRRSRHHCSEMLITVA